MIILIFLWKILDCLNITYATDYHRANRSYVYGHITFYEEDQADAHSDHIENHNAHTHDQIYENGEMKCDVHELEMDEYYSQVSSVYNFSY